MEERNIPGILPWDPTPSPDTFSFLYNCRQGLPAWELFSRAIPRLLASVPHFSSSLQLLLWYLSFLNTWCGEQAGHSRGTEEETRAQRD